MKDKAREADVVTEIKGEEERVENKEEQTEVLAEKEEDQ